MSFTGIGVFVWCAVLSLAIISPGQQPDQAQQSDQGLGPLPVQQADPAIQSHLIVAKVGDRAITISAVRELVKSRFPNLNVETLDSDERSNFERAAALNLVRRELAYQRLLAVGGQALEARIERKLALDSQALKRIDADAQLTEWQRNSIAWNVAWGEYLEAYMTEENLEKFFDSCAWKFDGTSVKISQIFMSDLDAKETLATLRQKIENKEISFSQAAKDNSQAPSAVDGGEIGWIQYGGDLPRSVAEPALAGEPKQIHGPIRSTFGWHLVWVIDKRRGDKAWEDVEDRATIQREAADFLFSRLIRAALESKSVEWLAPELAPPESESVVP